jgi:lipopolysaccharide transport system permease protein
MDSSSKEVLISNGKSALHYWREVWQSRELFWILAKRDILVRYKQTVLGVAWSIIRPLLTALVMVFAFGKIAKLDEDTSIAYMLVVMPGVIVWLFFSQSLAQISNSIVGNTNLVSKVYFPRLIVPLSSLMIGLLDAIIAFGLFVLLCFWYQYIPDWKIIFAPVFMFLAYMGAFGFGLIAAVLNVKYRDVGQIIPFMIQFGYFVSPIAYTSELVQTNLNQTSYGDWFYLLYTINPVAGSIDGLRWSLLGDFSAFNFQSFISLVIFDIVTLVISIRMFRKNENSFVDYI